MANLNVQTPIVQSVFNDKLAKLSDACEQALRDHLATVRDIVRLKYIEDGQARPEDDVVDICVSFDGTWHKRGHTSHTGIGVAIDILTGYVVDFEVVLNFCLVCEREKNMEDDRTLSSLKDFMAKHKEVCTINHSGSSNAMEVAAAKKIWEKSTNGPLHYVTMLSDGDSKAYDAVTNMKPYGNKLVKKEECVNHVAKRLGAALETLKKKSQGSGVPLGGRGMLTATMIKTLQTYYQNAIKNNAGMP